MYSEKFKIVLESLRSPDNRCNTGAALEYAPIVLRQCGQRQEAAVRPAPQARPILINVGQVGLEVVRDVDGVGDLVGAEVTVDGVQPLIPLQIFANDRTLMITSYITFLCFPWSVI